MIVSITGFPTGFNEVWAIGPSHFMSRARKYLLDLQDKGKFASAGREHENNQLYLLDNFEVITSIYHGSWAFTAQIKGAFNDLLSTKWKLPNYIILAFSNDQIEDLDILGNEIYPVLNSIFCNISRGITSRKLQLPKKALRVQPPTVIVVRTVTRSAKAQEVNNFKFKRRTLNRAIQETALKYNWKTINIQTILPHLDDLFDDRGDLSEEGFRTFWKYISQEVEMFEIKAKFRITQEQDKAPRDWSKYQHKPVHRNRDNW